jgi:drug/metabolite transporter (DMT)-like permease
MSERASLRPYLWMLGSTLSFSSMGALSQALAATSDWRLLTFVRAALMMVFAVGIAAVMRTPVLLKGTPMLWMRSIVGSVSMLATFYTLTHLPFSEATTLIKSYPMAVAVLSWIVFRERTSGKVWIAIVVGAVGVVVMMRPHFDQAGLALFTGILSSVCTATVMLGLNRLSALDARSIVLHFSIVSTLICGVVFAAAGAPLPAQGLADARSLSMLFGIGLLGTMGQIFLTRAFALGDPSAISVVGLTELIFAMGYDRILWQRAFSASTLIGMALVAAPTTWLLFFRRRAPAASPRPPGSAAPTTLP